MTREEKIAAIYTVIMRKETSILCRDCLYKKGLRYPGPTKGIDGKCSECGIEEKDVGLKISTLHGGKCLIGNIFERYSASKGFINSQFIIALIDKWTGYDKSIEDQSDECIDYVYSLIQKD